MTTEHDEIVEQTTANQETGETRSLAKLQAEVRELRAEKLEREKATLLAERADAVARQGVAAPRAPSTPNNPWEVGAHVHPLQLPEAAINAMSPMEMRKLHEDFMQYEEQKAGRPPTPTHSRQKEIAEGLMKVIRDQEANHRRGKF